MKKPIISESALVFPGAFVLGDTELEENVSVWYNAVIRADAHSVRIGKNSNIQDCVVIHGDADVIVGEGVSVGHSAVLHGCTIEDNVLVGMGCVIMDGAVVGRDSIVGAGTLITKNKKYPAGSLIMGSPGKVVRQLTPEEIQSNVDNRDLYIRLMNEARENL